MLSVRYIFEHNAQSYACHKFTFYMVCQWLLTCQCRFGHKQNKICNIVYRPNLIIYHCSTYIPVIPRIKANKDKVSRNKSSFYYYYFFFYFSWNVTLEMQRHTFLASGKSQTTFHDHEKFVDLYLLMCG